MPIEVQCPNGHRLACSDDRAGKQGKCPKCGTTFTVPKSNGAPASESAGTPDKPDDVKQEPSAGKLPEGAGGSASQGRATSEPQIQFLCPNGHKLVGSPSLQGRPGQCPNCGAKFRIPVYDVSDDEQFNEEFEEDLSRIGSEMSEQGELDSRMIEEIPELEAGTEQEPEPQPPPEHPAADFLPMMEDEDDENMHPLARLFTTLWQEREHGGVVELHIGDGVVIVPDWWAIELSLQNHGVFALQAPDGSYVVETVAWDAIKRISIRRINELPDGVFA